MCTTVNTAFDKFNADFVNLDPKVTSTARSSRDWLINQLITFPDKISDFPKLYKGMHIRYGSFARNVKIRPLDDIDLLLTFSAEGTTYKRNQDNFTLHAPETAANLRKLCNNDGSLNSIKLVNKLVASLDKVEQYKAAEKHRRQEAATLELTSYDWNFDIVPAFYTDTGHYIIPDGQGEWKASDPRIDQLKINKINAKHTGKVLQLIRTLKYWNRYATMTTIPSYLFENIVLNFCDGKDSIDEHVDINCILFWYHLEDAIFLDVPDPKGFQGNLNTLTYEEKKSISLKAEDASQKGNTAFDFEKAGEHQKAINKWREVFGDNFPKYE